MAKALTKPKKERKTNPNGVNQHTEPDPRQALFLSLYMDPKSPTFGNAYQSALAAKYSEPYAAQITAILPDWLVENTRKRSFVEKAERHLEEVLNLPNIAQAMGAFGPVFEKKESFSMKRLKNGKMKKVKKVEKIPVMVPQVAVIKQKTEVSKLVLPAHSPDVYGKKDKGSSFIFNIQPVRERYQEPSRINITA